MYPLYTFGQVSKEPCRALLQCRIYSFESRGGDGGGVVMDTIAEQTKNGGLSAEAKTATIDHPEREEWSPTHKFDWHVISGRSGG